MCCSAWCLSSEVYMRTMLPISGASPPQCSSGASVTHSRYKLLIVLVSSRAPATGCLVCNGQHSIGIVMTMHHDNHTRSSTRKHRCCQQCVWLRAMSMCALDATVTADTGFPVRLTEGPAATPLDSIPSSISVCTHANVKHT